MSHSSAKTAVKSFLAKRSPLAVQQEAWGEGLVLTVSSYLDDRYPPEPLITSVRGLVLLDRRVVMLENRDGKHLLPGGRREASESYLETLRRETAEECGLEVMTHEYLGFTHLRHESAKPAGYAYPYPDFFHLVYAVRATGHLKSNADDYEEAATAIPPREARLLPNAGFAQPFLERALRSLDVREN